MRVVVLKIQLTLLLTYLIPVVKVGGQETPDTTSDTSPPTTTAITTEPVTTIAENTEQNTENSAQTTASNAENTENNSENIENNSENTENNAETTEAASTASKLEEVETTAVKEHVSGEPDVTETEINDGTSPHDVEETKADVNFLVPNRISDVAEGFTFQDEQYVIVQSEVNQETASMLCRVQYSGILSIVNTMEVAQFLSEALAETDIYFNTLWIGGMKHEDKWRWLQPNVDFNDELFNQLVITNPHTVLPNTSFCLAFGRDMHLKPQFRCLSCSAQRSFICQRPASDDKAEISSSATGWLKMGNKRFRIFYDKVSWEIAEAKCAIHNVNATLAIVETAKEAEFLGRYLLIGRPSLENAWIGAKWNTDIYAYEFFNNKIKLDNSTKDDGYPPWRTKTILKTEGCLLLDRHITNHTVFVETRCERHRSYICSVDDTRDCKTSDNIDFILSDRGYRLERTPKNWQQAYDHCDLNYQQYQGHLAKVKDETDFFNILNCMGENLTEVQHIWVSGKYIDNKWKWMPENEEISVDTVRLVKNISYWHDVEKDNTCLNMDRENHMTGFSYGTNCVWSQAFICSFDAEQLNKLREDSQTN